MTSEEKTPVISVLMCVYKTPEPYLRRAIESILEQSFSDFELIILMARSSENCDEVIRSYSDERIRFYEFDENVQPSVRMEYGLQIVRGKYIAFMDSDDISLPERFAKQYAYMESHDKIAALGSAAQRFNEKKELGIAVPECLDGDETTRIRMLFYDAAFVASTGVVRKSFLDKIQFHYNSIPNAGDYLIFASIAYAGGGLTALPECLVRYRIYAGQMNVMRDRRLRDGSQEKTGGMIVQQQLLEPLLGSMSDEEIQTHIALHYRGLSVSVAQCDTHIQRLLEANERIALYDKKLFRKELMSIWSLRIFSTALKKHDYSFFKSKFFLRSMAPNVLAYDFHKKITQRLKCARATRRNN